MSAFWAAALLGFSLAQTPAEVERAELRLRLQEEARLQKALLEDRGALLEALAFYEWKANLNRARAAQITSQESALKRQLAAATRREAWAAKRTELLLQGLSPRLLSFYRLLRRNPLDVLLSAQDFQTLLRTQKALGLLLEEDLLALAELKAAQEAQQVALEGLDRLKVRWAEKKEAWEAEAEASAEITRQLTDLSAALKAQANQSSRNAAELAHAERQVARLLQSQQLTAAPGALSSLRGKLPWPASGPLEMGFGKVVSAKTGTALWHKGIDLRAALGAPVRAVAAGVVVFSGRLRGYGPVLIVEHAEGFHSVMAHLASVEVALHQKVSAGQLLAKVGEEDSDKGAYLHFQLRQAGVAVDPLAWLEREPRP